MSVYFDKQTGIFYLESNNTSYVIKVNRFGFLSNLYYGKKIAREDLSYTEVLRDRGSEVAIYGAPERKLSLMGMSNEYPAYGKGDFRECAFIPQSADGSRVFESEFEGYEILKEKPPIDGMPSLSGGETLVLKLYDKISNVRVKLFYTVYDDVDAIARRAEIENLSDSPLMLNRAYSFNVDFPDGKYRVLTQHGAHLREREPEITPVMHGVISVDSKRGATSLHSSCFAALLEGNADEDHGNVYGFNLIYSGSFKLNVEQSPYDTVRVNGGINDFDFSWKLESGEKFSTPEVALVYSDGGVGKMSRTFHDLYRKYIINPRYVNELRPIVINNWEATYFNFDIPKLCSIIDTIKDSGINMFVLDDGWFGKRDNDKSGLGDWTVNEQKLKGSLKTLIDYCHASGLKFGLWFEPEMVSEDSDVYRAHPDWAIKIPYRNAAPSRDQLVFDLTKKEVRDYIVEAVEYNLKKYDIDYVKWDMNRNITENFSDGLPADRQTEIMHRYILGLYDICERLIKGNPDIFFEGCSSGGGRFDPAMAYYFPQIWTSDDTDANERVKIQYGTSLCYPLSLMSCHVSICPNHSTNRTASFATRGHIAHLGATGYELDTTKINESDLGQIKGQVEQYHKMERLILEGDLYRLENPFEGNYFGFEVTSKDKSQSVITCYKTLDMPNNAVKRFYPKGLAPDAVYLIEETGAKLSGSTIMNVGLIPYFPWSDFATVVFNLTRVK